MNANRHIPTILVLASALTLVTTTASAQSFDAKQVARNAALQASPRHVEELSATSAQGRNASVRAGLPVTHSGFAASPRGLEELQAFASVPSSAQKARPQRSIRSLQPHQGLASTPRQVEELQAYQLPGVSAAPSVTYEIAPLK